MVSDMDSAVGPTLCPWCSRSPAGLFSSQRATGLRSGEFRVRTWAAAVLAPGGQGAWLRSCNYRKVNTFGFTGKQEEHSGMCGSWRALETGS